MPTALIKVAEALARFGTGSQYVKYKMMPEEKPAAAIPSKKRKI
jgi:hypothetical protein